MGSRNGSLSVRIGPKSIALNKASWEQASHAEAHAGTEFLTCVMIELGPAPVSLPVFVSTTDQKYVRLQAGPSDAVLQSASQLEVPETDAKPQDSSYPAASGRGRLPKGPKRTPSSTARMYM